MEQLTEVLNGNIAKIGLIFGVLFVMFGVGSTYITCILGVAYPTFKSFLALESPKDSNDDKQWLTYWVVFGLFNIID